MIKKKKKKLHISADAMTERKNTLKRLNRLRKCDVCKKENIPQHKFSKHQYWLGGVRIPLCRGMPKSIRSFYEEQSVKRLRKYKANARTLGLEGKAMESYLRNLGFGDEVR